jgi:hypothetical protein
MVQIMNLSLFVDYLNLVKGKIFLGYSLPVSPHSFTNTPLTSGMDKGKGKAIDIPEVEEPKSPNQSEKDLEEEIRILKAVAYSLEPTKVGESSKRIGKFSKIKGYKEDSPVQSDPFEKLMNYTQD